MNRQEKYVQGEHVEFFDPDPVELPVGYHHPEDIQTMIRRMVVDVALNQRMRESGVETFEEANDLDPEQDDPEFVSRYEVTEMEVDTFNQRYRFDEERGEYVPRERENNQSEPTEGSRPGDGDAEQKVSKKKVKKPVDEDEAEDEE